MELKRDEFEEYAIRACRALPYHEIHCKETQHLMVAVLMFMRPIPTGAYRKIK